jgi:hypothetical protein
MTSKTLAATAVLANGTSTVDKEAASTIEKMVSAVVVNPATTPKRERQNLRDRNMLVPASTIVSGSSGGMDSWVVGEVVV